LELSIDPSSLVGQPYHKVY